MTRVAIRFFAATVAAAVALSGAAVAGDMSSAGKIKKMDTNGDGKLSAAEHEAWARDMFTKMDTNKDGSVTAAEMDASHKRMMKEHSKMDHHKMDHHKMDHHKKAETKPKSSGY